MQDQSEFQEANIEQAKEYQKRQKVHSVEDQNVKVEGLMVSLNKLDIGSQYYFKYLLWLIISFIIYFLILIKPLEYNYTRSTSIKFTDSISKQFKFTITHRQPLLIPYPIPPYGEKYMLLQPYYLMSKLISDPVVQLQQSSIDTYVKESKTNLDNQMIPDLILCIVFILASMILPMIQNMVYIKHKKQKVTVKDYTVKVISCNKDINPGDIQTHFNKFGEIVEVGYSLNSNGRMFYAQREMELDLQIRKEQKKQQLGQTQNTKFLQSLYFKKQQNQDKRKELEKQTSDCRKYNWFYVTFNEFSTKNEVLRFFNQNSFSLFFINIFMSSETKSKLLVKNSNRIYVQDIDEPNDIYWENQDYGYNMVYKLKRYLILTIISILTVIIFSSIYVSSKKSYMLNIQDQDHYYVILLLLGLYNPLLHKGTYELNQYCLQSGFTLSEINDQHLCYKNLQAQSDYKTTYFTAAILMIFIVLLLKEIVVFITKRELFQTKTQKNKSIYTRVFVQQFIITNITLTLLPGKVGSFSLHDVIDNMFGINSLNKGWSTDDMDNRFWVQIATTVAIFLFLQIFISHIFSMIYHLIYQMYKNQSINSYRLQGDLNRWIKQDRFNLATKYAFLSNIMVVSLSYCSGQPMLIPIAVLVFIFSYLFDKFILIKLCSKPKSSQQNEYLQQHVNSSLNYILLIKVIYSIWTYSSPKVYPNSGDMIIQANQNPKFNQMLVINFRVDYQNVQDVFVRLTTNPGLIVIFFYVLILIIFYRYIRIIMVKLMGLICKKVGIMTPFAFTSTTTYTVGNYQQEVSGLTEYTSYDLKKNPKYCQAYQLLESEVMKKIKIEKVEIDKELLNINSVGNTEETQNVELLKNGQ